VGISALTPNTSKTTSEETINDIIDGICMIIVAKTNGVVSTRYHSSTTIPIQNKNNNRHILYNLHYYHFLTVFCFLAQICIIKISMALTINMESKYEEKIDSRSYIQDLNYEHSSHYVFAFKTAIVKIFSIFQ